MSRALALCVLLASFVSGTEAAVGQIDPNCVVESTSVDGKVTKRPCYDAGVAVAEVKDLRARGRFESCTGPNCAANSKASDTHLVGLVLIMPLRSMRCNHATC
eukprot:SAG31_NODE_691_length_12779_cov_19.035095_2_plen_103_part_00